MYSESILGIADPAKVAPPAVKLLCDFHRNPSAERCLGIAAAFILVCEYTRMHPGTLMSTAQNILARCRKEITEFRAADMYIEKEWE